MPTASDSALLLAGQLRSSSDEDLRELIRTREVRGAGIRDFFDLADALLDPASVRLGLSHVDRHGLAALAALGDLGTAAAPAIAERVQSLGGDPQRVPDALDLVVGRGLAVRDGERLTALRPVSADLASWPDAGLPSAGELVADPPPGTLAPVHDSDRSAADATAAERAFTTTGAIVDLLTSLAAEPAHELSRGGLSLPDAKRLASAAGAELGDVAALVRIAERAGLVARGGGLFSAADGADEWTAGPTASRWARLASAWLAELSPDVRDVLAARAHSRWGDRLDEYVDWLYPAGGAWMRDRVRAFSEDAALLGITAHHIPSTPGVALLTSEADGAEAMAALLPAEITSVYLQQDLSVIAPGPLSPELESTLRSIAELESRGLASTWRVTPESLTRALAAGASAEGIRSFLTRVSLTGIPQPLEYALEDAAQRFGLVRVTADTEGRGRVRSTDVGLLRAIEVDRTLAPLALRRDGDDLRSRFERDVVFFALADARYPVVAEDARGRTVIPERRRAARVTAAPSDPVGQLIARLREHATGPVETGAAWLARQLDVAIRGKLAVTVTVLVPDGSTADYRLEPSSVAGGRVRGRDRGADIERTLPLSSITAVSSA